MRSLDLWKDRREQALVTSEGLRILKTYNDKYYVLMAWKPKALKPFINTLYRTSEAMDHAVERILENHRFWQKQKEKRREDRKGTPEDLAKVQPGMIFYNSWGYEQTNVDFYQVISRKNRDVIIQQICRELTNDPGFAPMAGNCVALKDEFKERSEPFRKRLSFYEGRPSIPMECGTAIVWDGKPKYVSWYA